MRRESFNAAGGSSVFLGPGDSLSRLTAPHANLVTPEVARVFEDPVSHYREIARRSPFRELTNWLETLLRQGDWELGISTGDTPDGEWNLVGIRWNSDSAFGAAIGVPNGTIDGALPPALRHYYSLVDFVHWTCHGGAGGLDGARRHSPMSVLYLPESQADVDPERTFLFGGNGCGDQLVYALDGRGGFWQHETGIVHWLGSIEAMIDWTFRELREGREPESNRLPAS